MSALAEPWMDDLEGQLAVTARRMSQRLSARRRIRRIAAVAVAAALILSSAALAKTPFHPIASFQNLIGAQRTTRPIDSIPPGIRAVLEHSGFRIETDETRLMAALTDGNRLYAAPRPNGDLCLIHSGGAMECGPPLGPDVPIMWLATSTRGKDTLVAGLTRDDVRRVTIHMAGRTVVVPVHGNAFSYHSTTGWKVPSSFVLDLDDGSRVVYSTGVAP